MAGLVLAWDCGLGSGSVSLSLSSSDTSNILSRFIIIMKDGVEIVSHGIVYLEDIAVLRVEKTE